MDKEILEKYYNIFHNLSKYCIPYIKHVYLRWCSIKVPHELGDVEYYLDDDCDCMIVDLIIYNDDKTVKERENLTKIALKEYKIAGHNADSSVNIESEISGKLIEIKNKINKI